MPYPETDSDKNRFHLNKQLHITHLTFIFLCFISWHTACSGKDSRPGEVCGHDIYLSKILICNVQDVQAFPFQVSKSLLYKQVLEMMVKLMALFAIIDKETMRHYQNHPSISKTWFYSWKSAVEFMSW